MLMGLVGSPVVDMLASWDGEVAEWVPVSINADTFTRGASVLQDFEFELTLPVVNLATL